MAKRQVFTYDGVAHHLGDLKVRDVEELEGLLGVAYGDIRLSRMRHKLAIMAVFLRRDGRSDDEVAAILDELDLDTADGMWTLEPDDLPEQYQDGIPLAAGEPSTPTS